MTPLLFQKIYMFLQEEHPSDERIVEGATFMLKTAPGRYRALYNSTLKRPQSFLPWVRAELRKQYDIHKRGLNREDVEQYNKETVEAVRETLSKVPESVDVSGGENAEADDAFPVEGVRGKRADHDSLPEEIKALWNRNAERWKKMRALHMQLSAMIASPDYEPCDGNELCFQLRQADTDLRNDYALYDGYTPEPETAGDDASSHMEADPIKVIQKCRAAITRNMKAENPTDEQLSKVQEAVNTLVSLKQSFKPETVERLKAAGISIPTA